MTHRFNFNNDMYLVVQGKDGKSIKSVEIEGEVPLIVCNAERRNGELWAYPHGYTEDVEIPVTSSYEETNEEGTTHVWKWTNKDEEVRLVIFNSENPKEFPAQVVFNAGTSLFVFMTDFEEWVFAECYGNPVKEAEGFCVRWLKENYQKGETPNE